MTSTDLLDHQFFQPNDEGPQRTLERVNAALWFSRLIDVSESNFHAYLQYFGDQCPKKLRSNHAAQSYRDIRNIVSHINENPNIAKNNLLDSLCREYPSLGHDLDKITRSMELGLRLWLMTNVESLELPYHITLQEPLRWPETSTTSEMFKDFFPINTSNITTRRTFLPIFNAHKLEEIAGFRFEWTDNLYDHLSLKDDRVIYLFYHVSVLRSLKKSVSSEILAQAFFDETLNTLALLLPRTDLECVKWFQKAQSIRPLDPAISALSMAPREVSKYQHWRDRLLIIQDAFDCAEPATMSQWWHDRRKKVQWNTFWVAILILILTIFFGLVQSITGVVQAWASIKSLQS